MRVAVFRVGDVPRSDVLRNTMFIAQKAQKALIAIDLYGRTDLHPVLQGQTTKTTAVSRISAYARLPR